LLVVGQFDVEAALRRHLVRLLTDKLAPNKLNGEVNSPLQNRIDPPAN
jgi:hypothetical protein